VRDLLSWGDEFYAPGGPPRVFEHIDDAGIIDPNGMCDSCNRPVPPSDLLTLPGPGFDEAGEDVVSKALNGAHRLLEPIRGR
jgi:hypothetical protein